MKNVHKIKRIKKMKMECRITLVSLYTRKLLVWPCLSGWTANQKVWVKKVWCGRLLHESVSMNTVGICHVPVSLHTYGRFYYCRTNLSYLCFQTLILTRRVCVLGKVEETFSCFSFPLSAGSASGQRAKGKKFRYQETLVFTLYNFSKIY